MRAASTAPPYPPFFPFSYTTPALLAATYTFFNDRHYKERAPLYICSESFTRARAPVIDCSLYITHIEWGRRRRRHCTLCDVTPRVLATSPHAYIHRHTLHVHKYIHIGIYTHTHTYTDAGSFVRSVCVYMHMRRVERARYTLETIYTARESAPRQNMWMQTRLGVQSRLCRSHDGVTVIKTGLPREIQSVQL